MSPKRLHKRASYEKVFQCLFLVTIIITIIKTFSFSSKIRRSSKKRTTTKSLRHLNVMVTQHSSAVWPVPYACAKLYHPGSSSCNLVHGAAFLLVSTAPRNQKGRMAAASLKCTRALGTRLYQPWKTVSAAFIRRMREEPFFCNHLFTCNTTVQYLRYYIT